MAKCQIYAYIKIVLQTIKDILCRVELNERCQKRLVD